MGGRSPRAILIHKIRDYISIGLFLFFTPYVAFDLMFGYHPALFEVSQEILFILFGFDASCRDLITMTCTYADPFECFEIKLYFYDRAGMSRFITLHVLLNELSGGNLLFGTGARLCGVEFVTVWLNLYFSVSVGTIDTAYFEGLGLFVCVFVYVLVVWVLLLIIRGGAPRYRIEQLAQYAFVGLLPAVAGLVVLVGILLIIL